MAHNPWVTYRRHTTPSGNRSSVKKTLSNTKVTEQVELYMTEIRGSLDRSPGNKLPHMFSSPARCQSPSNGLQHLRDGGQSTALKVKIERI